ncbi:MAG: hypothetical protein C4526_00520, partial [Nitrospiraceae bacterium]
MIKILFLAAALIFSPLASNVNAESLWQTSVDIQDLSDQRTFEHPYYSPPASEGGLSGYWPYSFTIGWNIAYDLETSLWAYEYTLSADRKDISHFILEVSGSAGAESFYDVKINGSPADFE